MHTPSTPALPSSSSSFRSLSTSNFIIIIYSYIPFHSFTPILIKPEQENIIVLSISYEYNIYIYMYVCIYIYKFKILLFLKS